MDRIIHSSADSNFSSINEFQCRSPEETIALGCEIGKDLPKGSILCFFGDLGAGKTTFIKGIAQGAANIPLEHINSPTFVYLNIYTGKTNIHHFDLYRLHDVDEFLAMGFDEFLFSEGICCIEWSERITPILPFSCIHIEMKHMDENSRLITLSKRKSHE